MSYIAEYDVLIRQKLDQLFKLRSGEVKGMISINLSWLRHGFFVALCTLCYMNTSISVALPLAGLVDHSHQNNAGLWHRSSFTSTEILDPATGIRLKLPLDELIYSRPSTYGTNWRSHGNHSNVDTLNFKDGRSLSALFLKLTRIRGRNVYRSSFLLRHKFVIRGRDRDGNYIYVEAHKRGGEIRGLSIVYSRQSFEPTANAIAASFIPFPEVGDAKSKQAGQTPIVRNAEPATQPRSSAAAREEVQKLKGEIAKLREKTQELELQKRERELRERIEKELRAKIQKEFNQRQRSTRERREKEVAERRKREREEREQRQRIEKELREIERKKREIALLESRFKLKKSIQPPPLLPTGKRVAFVVGINKYSNLDSSGPTEDRSQRCTGDCRYFQKTGFRSYQPQP